MCYLLNVILLGFALIYISCGGNDNSAQVSQQDSAPGPAQPSHLSPESKKKLQASMEEGFKKGEPTSYWVPIALASKKVFVKLGFGPASIEDGKSWNTAYSSLQAAVDDNAKEDHVSFFVGTQGPVVIKDMPASGLWLDLSGFFGSDLRIYGGYLGNESNLERVEGKGAFMRHPLIIDADGKGPVMRKLNDKRTKITLFGVEIKHARAGAAEYRSNGSALEIRNAEIRFFHTKWSNNEAHSCGAILAEKSLLRFATVAIFENNTGWVGGAINAIDSTIIFDAATMFNGNRATHGVGGALRGYDTRIVINIPVTFKNNQAAIPDATAEYKDKQAATFGSAIWTNKAVEFGKYGQIFGASKSSSGEDWNQEN